MGASPASIVTATILADLEAGNLPAWRKPWDATNDMPRSVDGRSYRGINTWVLRLIADVKGYSDPRWLTYNKARELGGNIRRGEKATAVILWKPVKRTATNEDGETVEKSSVIQRYFSVFNVEQAENLTLPALARVERQNDPIEAAEAIIAGMPNPPTIVVRQSDRAYYVPATDTVTLPELAQYATPAEYYSTANHELSHATGHASRLDRHTVEDGHMFGSDGYGREELVAEFGASIVNAESGIGPATLVNSEAYIANWVRAIKADPALVVTAAAQGHKAADYILGRLAAEALPEAA
jgi:antirestriction protein ArdC